jgi:hypothetical protein
MKSPRYARLLAEAYKRVEPRGHEPLALPPRDEEIALIEQAMDRKRRHNHRLRLAARWSVAAVLVLGALGALRVTRDRASPPVTREPSTAALESGDVAPSVAISIASGSGALVATPGASTPVVAGRALQAGSRLMVDPNAGATLALSTGTHLAAEPGSQLSVVEDGRAQVFALHAGSLRADVAKLAAAERFIVRTLDAEVEVRGTSFLVDIVASDPNCGAGTTTRVTVYEGVVAVRASGHEEAVRSGERWPRGCRAPIAPVRTTPSAANRPAQGGGASSVARTGTSMEGARTPNAPTTAAPAVATMGTGDPATAARATAVPAAAAPATVAQPTAVPATAAAEGAAQRTTSSHLAEENNLFAEGMLARRSGNLVLALDRMDRLLERFPKSHLAENAAAERMRLWRILDPAKAVGAAKQYLQRYPAGFARADAEAIVAGTN